MKHTILAMVAGVALITTTAGTVFAIEEEQGEQYLLDDSESVSVLIEVDSLGVTSFVDAFVIAADGTEYFIDSDSAKKIRLYDDGKSGMIFGYTVADEPVLIRYSIDGDRVQLAAKVWTISGDKERIVTSGHVIGPF